VDELNDDDDDDGGGGSVVRALDSGPRGREFDPGGCVSE